MTTLIVLLVTILTALACSLIGNFLVLRKLSLMGDAISHAVLPGIVLAFLIVGGLESPLFFVLAVAFALVMAFVIQFITDRVRISRESIIGIVFTSLFALGVVLIVQFANNVHLDQDAVLYGAVEFSAWNRFVLWGVDLGVRSLWSMGIVLFVNVFCIALFWKELKLSTFDPVLAESLGFSVKRMHYLVMLLTAVTVVAAFESVGAILVVALLVVPSATAYLISENLGRMIFLSSVFAILSSVLGFYFAFWLDVSIAGSVATMSGLFMFLVFCMQYFFGRLRRS